MEVESGRQVEAPAPEPEVKPPTGICRDCGHWDPASNKKGARECQMAKKMTAHNSKCDTGGFKAF
jgi:hypothetical protein